MSREYCYLTAAVGLENGKFEPEGYGSANGGKIRVSGKTCAYVDPDASCDKLYDDLIAFYDMTSCTYSPYHCKFTKKKFGGQLVLIDEYGNQMSSDYIGPSKYWAHVKGGMTDAEIGEMLLRSRTIGGHMLWPVHPIPTINTARGGRGGFYDRIDLTLQEIRYMMTNDRTTKNQSVRNAIEKEKDWFSLFAVEAGIGGFKSFINNFKLNPFVFGDEYYVISLAESNSANGEFVPVLEDEPMFPADFKKYVR
ncbi:MAG: hypothetical protein LUG92_02775, partial [Oscillospiraceae bacterium]|nr:hypothetical protein [Oscillospiraceae bacterium]